ncbi:MAG: hypothetical protein K2P45_13235 [Eubacterium sp.]|nr:hypothetical protein [Eubacterium sp.]
MNYKKSMRIFWISLGLLLAVGTVIIAAAQYRSQHFRAEGSYKKEEPVRQAVRPAQTQPDEPRESEDAAASFAAQTQQVQRSEGSGQKPDEHTVEYRFELKVKNGYLDVYHYHTENLFFHTGVPYSDMTLKQRQELENGKYFINEQELYGYLESCTS